VRKRLCLGLVVAAVGALSLGCNSALADTLPTWTNSCSSDIDVASCERLSYIATQSSQMDSMLQGIGWAVGVLAFLVVVGVFMRTFGRES
jgi:hypothetical protein